MRTLLRLIVAVLMLAVTLFHTEVFAQLTGTVAGSTDVPSYLKWCAFAAVAVLVAIRRLR